MKRRTKVVIGVLALRGALDPIERVALHVPSLRKRMLPMVVKANWSDERCAVLAEMLHRRYGYDYRQAALYVYMLRDRAKQQAAKG
jgi:hypothetical protein